MTPQKKKRRASYQRVTVAKTERKNPSEMPRSLGISPWPKRMPNVPANAHGSPPRSAAEKKRTTATCVQKTAIGEDFEEFTRIFSTHPKSTAHPRSPTMKGISFFFRPLVQAFPGCVAVWSVGEPKRKLTNLPPLEVGEPGQLHPERGDKISEK